jgi:hypothetical protein
MRIWWLILAVVAGCDRGSSCKDSVVAAQTTLRLDRSEAETMIGRCELTPWTGEERACVRAARDIKSLVACGQDLASVTDASPEIAKMSEFTDLMCACKTADCAQRVSDRITLRSQDMAQPQRDPPRMTEDQVKRATELGDKMAECMRTAMGSPTLDPPPRRR